MNRFFYGKTLSKTQKQMFFAMFSPALLIPLLWFTQNIAITSLVTTFSSLPLCAIVLLCMDQGPAFWKWWISFGFGHTVELPDKKIWFDENDDDIQKWIKENIKGSCHAMEPCHRYIFLFKKDAFSFKMRW